MRFRLFRFLVSGLLVSGLFVPFVSAHGDRPSLEAEVGNYLIDVGYDADLVEDKDIPFDFDLFVIGPPIDYADFATVEVRITREGMELLNETIVNDGMNVPGLTVQFPDKGGYDMDVRYMNTSDSLIVARTFHLEVLPASMGIVSQGFDLLHYALAIFLVGFTIFLVVRSLKIRFPGKPR